jgi:hypothetical protein
MWNSKGVAMPIRKGTTVNMPRAAPPLLALSSAMPHPKWNAQPFLMVLLW